MADTFVLNSSDKDAAPGTATKAAKDVAPVTCEFVGCQNPVKKSPTGRPAKYCPEHAGGRAKTSPNKSALTGKTWSEAAEVEAILKQFVGTLSMGISLVNAEDGKIIAKGGPDVVHELVELAKDDVNLRKYLTSLTAPGKYGPLVMASLFGVIIPIMANHGMLAIPVQMMGTTSSKKGEK